MNKPTSILFEIQTRAHATLVRWDVLTECKTLDPNHLEIGNGHAANLRGTLKNPAASGDVIKSLTDDLEFRIQKLTEKQPAPSESFTIEKLVECLADSVCHTINCMAHLDTKEEKYHAQAALERLIAKLQERV